MDDFVVSDAITDDAITDLERLFPFKELLKLDYFQKYRRFYYRYNDEGRQIHPCTAPGFLDTRLRYAAWRSSYCSRASSGVRYASFSRRQHWL